MRRTDQPTASLDLDARLDLAARRLGIKLEGSETGGLVAAATGQPQAGPVRLSLEGDGPLDDWRGRLLADAEGLARLETTLDLAYASTRRIRVDGTFTAAPGVLPANIAPVVGDRVTLALHAGETSPGVFALDQLLLQAGAVSLTGTGTADVNADRLDGRAELQVPALADLSGLAGIPLAGDARLTLGATGRVAEPALRLELAGNGITADAMALARLGGGFDVTLLRSAEGAIAGARVDGAADADGLSVAGRQLGDGRATLALQAEAPAGGPGAGSAAGAGQRPCPARPQRCRRPADPGRAGQAGRRRAGPRRDPGPAAAGDGKRSSAAGGALALNGEADAGRAGEPDRHQPDAHR